MGIMTTKNEPLGIISAGLVIPSDACLIYYGENNRA